MRLHSHIMTIAIYKYSQTWTVSRGRHKNLKWVVIHVDLSVIKSILLWTKLCCAKLTICFLVFMLKKRVVFNGKNKKSRKIKCGFCTIFCSVFYYPVSCTLVWKFRLVRIYEYISKTLCNTWSEFYCGSFKYWWNAWNSIEKLFIQVPYLMKAMKRHRLHSSMLCIVKIFLAVNLIWCQWSKSSIRKIPT